MDEAEHDEHAGELAEETWDVGFDGERFEVDDAEEELTLQDAELQRQATAKPDE